MTQGIVLGLVFSGISLLAAVAAPLAAAVLLCRRKKGALAAIGGGALGFFAGAIVLETLCHQLVSMICPDLPQYPVLFGLYGALAAGVFEETARLIVLRRLCRKDAGVYTGLGYGVGHGGLEALYIGLVGLSANPALLIAVASGKSDTMLQNLSDPAQRAALQTVLDSVTSAAPVDFLAGGVERIVALLLQIALSLLVWMTVAGRLPKWGYPLAIALHAGVDLFPMAYKVGAIRSIWMIELCIAVYAAVVCAGVWRAYRRTAPDTGAPGAAQSGQ